MLRISLFVLFSLLLNTIVCSQVRFVNEFLNIGVGARGLGMSGSIVASVNDGTSGYYNTAGLTEIDAPLQINAMHSEWFGGIAGYDYFSLAKRINKSNSSYAALSFIRLGVDNIPNTLNLVSADGSVNYDRITNFSASDYAFILSYATKLGNQNKWSVGGNVKIIRRVIGPFASAWGFGSDFSFKYKLNKNVVFGLSARDITTTFNAWTFDLDEESKQTFIATNNEIPESSIESTLPRIVLASAYRNSIKKWTYLVELDLNISTDGRESAIFSSADLAMDPSIGIEVGYANRVFIRGGIGNIQQSYTPDDLTIKSTDFQPNVGLGIRLGRIRIDYALANVGNVSGVLASHVFSVGLDFKDRKKKQVDDQINP